MSTAQVLIQQNDALAVLENADRLWHLQQTGLTEGFSLREMRRLANACSEVLLAKEQKVFSQEAPADALFLVNRGTIRLTAANPQGREKIIGFLGNGEVFGEEVLESSKRRRSQAIAHEESWASVLERETLSTLLEEIPRLSLNLITMLSRKLAQAQDEIETLSFSDTEQRIARTLLKLSQQHGMKIVSSQALRKLRIPVPHEYLAQIIGANRPHVSAIMSDFKKKGWIRYHKRKLLINVDRMAGLVESKD